MRTLIRPYKTTEERRQYVRRSVLHCYKNQLYQSLLLCRYSIHTSVFSSSRKPDISIPYLNSSCCQIKLYFKFEKCVLIFTKIPIFSIISAISCCKTGGNSLILDAFKNQPFMPAARIFSIDKGLHVVEILFPSF